MATKLKNNSPAHARLAVSYYLLAFAFLCAVDLYFHRHIWGIVLEALQNRVLDTAYLDNAAANTTYLTNIRQRLVKEIILGAPSLLAGSYLYWKERGKSRPPGLRFAWLTSRPADVSLVLLAFIGLGMLFISSTFQFFILPLSVRHMVMLSILAYLTAVFLALAERLLPAFYSPKHREEEWKGSLIRRFLMLCRYALSDFRLIFAACIILGATALAGFMMAVIMIQQAPEALLFIAAYLLVAFPCLLYILGSYNMIRSGARDMAGGNLERQLETTGRGLFGSLAASINNMKEGYQTALEEQVKSERLKTELITNVSHDLKTPLTSIVNYVDLLRAPGLDGETRDKYLEVLTQKTGRLKLLIDDLFEASKMASGTVELQMEKIDVAALLEQALAEFSDKIAASSLTFRVKGAENHLYAHLDGRKMWRVFENLIGNALKYSLPGTRVYMELLEEETGFTFIMKNISAYEIDFQAEELMERFKRGDASRSTEGSGLGLAIAKSIVELQGGIFRVDLDGDVFKVILRLPKGQNRQLGPA